MPPVSAPVNSSAQTSSNSTVIVSAPAIRTSTPNTKVNASMSGNSSLGMPAPVNVGKPSDLSTRAESTTNYPPVLDLRQSPSIVPNGNTHSNPGKKETVVIIILGA